MGRTLLAVAEVVEIEEPARRHRWHLGRAHPPHEEGALTAARGADEVQPRDVWVVAHDRDAELALRPDRRLRRVDRDVVAPRVARGEERRPQLDAPVVAWHDDAL